MEELMTKLKTIKIFYLFQLFITCKIIYFLSELFCSLFYFLSEKLLPLGPLLPKHLIQNKILG